MAKETANYSLEEILPKIAQIAIFSDFDISASEDARILSEVLENMSTKNYRAGDIIIREGEIGSEFFILISGSAHISRKTPAGDSIALADLDASMNVFFGETALISDDERSATVTALTDCKVIVLTGKTFDALCKKEPLLGCRVFRRLARNLMGTVQKTNQDKAALYEALFNEIDSGEE